MKKVRVTALGDSLTKGVVCADNFKYSILQNSFVDIVSDEMDLYVERYAKVGGTVGVGHGLLERHSYGISQSDYTLLEYGSNDCDFDWMKVAESPSLEHEPKTLLDNFKAMFLMLIKKVQELGSNPVLLSMPPIDSKSYFSFITKEMSQSQKENVLKWLGGDVNVMEGWHNSYNEALFEVAASAGVEIIDITSPFKSYGEDKRKLFCADGVHPNSEGHRLIAGVIVNAYL